MIHVYDRYVGWNVEVTWLVRSGCAVWLCHWLLASLVEWRSSSVIAVTSSVTALPRSPKHIHCYEVNNLIHLLNYYSSFIVYRTRRVLRVLCGPLTVIEKYYNGNFISSTLLFTKLLTNLLYRRKSIGTLRKKSINTTTDFRNQTETLSMQSFCV